MSGRLGRSALLSAAIGLAGCGSSPPISFYTLSAEASSASKTQDTHERRITIGPITLPEVIERPQLVLRTGPNTVTLAEEHQWAEPLKSEIPRVIAENLGRLLGTRQVSVYPQTAGDHAQYRVSVDVQQFESTLGHGVSIDTLWSIRESSERDPVFKTGRSSINEPANGPTYEALAAAHSRGLVRISQDIAEAIRATPP